MLCTFILSEADCRVQSLSNPHGDNEFVVVPHKLRPVTICERDGKDVPQSMLEESVKGGVNH